MVIYIIKSQDANRSIRLKNTGKKDLRLVVGSHGAVKLVFCDRLPAVPSRLVGELHDALPIVVRRLLAAGISILILFFSLFYIYLKSLTTLFLNFHYLYSHLIKSILNKVQQTTG